MAVVRSVRTCARFRAQDLLGTVRLAVVAIISVLALEPALLHLPVPPRTLVLALSFAPAVRGRADAALDHTLVDAASFRRALSEEDN